jgi:hypothetical protein
MVRRPAEGVVAQVPVQQQESSGNLRGIPDASSSYQHGGVYYASEVVRSAAWLEPFDSICLGWTLIQGITISQWTTSAGAAF